MVQNPSALSSSTSFASLVSTNQSSELSSTSVSLTAGASAVLSTSPQYNQSSHFNHSTKQKSLLHHYQQQKQHVTDQQLQNSNSLIQLANRNPKLDYLINSANRWLTPDIHLSLNPQRPQLKSLIQLFGLWIFEASMTGIVQDLNGII